MTGAASGTPQGRESLFFAAAEATRIPMLVCDPRLPDSPIVFANAAFVAMSGYAREELLGRNGRVLHGPGTDRATVEAVRAAEAERRTFSCELLTYRKDGAPLRNALFVSPLFDGHGPLVHVFAVPLAGSRRREAEASPGQARTGEAPGRFIGGIAHDFNNLLQVVVGYVDILASGLRKPEVDRARLGRAAETIRQAADRAAILTRQLLAFSHEERPEGGAVNLDGLLDALLDGMDDSVRQALGEAVSVGRAEAPGLWDCRVDPARAEAAILDLLASARNAMPGGGTITLTTANRHVAEGGLAGAGPLRAGRYVSLSVTDTGTGIPPDVPARVTHPLSATGEDGQGAGPGLSLVCDLARRSGGAVQVASRVGEGTTVVLFLPAADTADEIAAPAPGQDERCTETVLVVDDRGDVAELARTILRDCGYRTLVAGDAREALDILAASEPVDLLFSDLIMPGGMNGLMLAREARKRQPDLKILLTTGYAEASLERTDVGGSEFEILSKPYRRSDLSRRVRQILDASAARP